MVRSQGACMMLNYSAFQSKVDRLRLPWWSFVSNVLTHRSGQPFIYFLLSHDLNQEHAFPDSPLLAKV